MNGSEITNITTLEHIFYYSANFGPPLFVALVAREFMRSKEMFSTGSDALLAICSIMATIAASFWFIKDYICPPLKMYQVPLSFGFFSAITFLWWCRYAHPTAEKFCKAKHCEGTKIGFKDKIKIALAWVIIITSIIFTTMVFIWRRFPFN